MSVNTSSDEENFPEILTIKNPKQQPLINNVKQRCLLLSPTVRAGLERECVMQDFDKDGREIGKGGFGQVWKVIHKATQKVYCIKVIAKQGIIDQKLTDQMNREIKIMYLLNHPHCLRLKNHFEDNDNFYLIMPLAVKGQLYKILKRAKKFDERTTAQILRETISALQYLHSFHPPIIHRDLKPENLLLNENGRILLADFGWSNFNNGEEQRKTFCGTPEYIAPEMLKKEGHDHRIDIWSVGVLMFELLSGYSPFSAKSNMDLYQNIKKLKIHWPTDMPPLAKNLITKILKIDPKERLSLEEILKHKWFQQTKIIKPLLENDLHTHKDLLMFHMMNQITPEIEMKIDELLGVSETKNHSSKVTSASSSPGSTKRDSVMETIKKNAAANGGNISSIDMTKEKMDKLNLENIKIKQENNTLKTKILSIESELKNLRTQSSSKVNEEGLGDLQEKVKSQAAEIERLQVMEKDRFVLLSEMEEKNNKLRELTANIKMEQSEKEQLKKDFENLKNQIKELNKQIELKDLTIDHLNKKADELLQEKEQQACEYEKKIEVLQINVLENASGSENQESMSKVVNILNGSVNEMKNIFSKKFDVFSEDNSSFKKEFVSRNDQFIAILNEKSLQIIDQIQKLKSSINQDIEKAFSNSNKPTNEVKDQRIEWLNNQLSELSVYKKKGLEYERKISNLSSELETTSKKFEMTEKELEALKKNVELKTKSIKQLKDQIQNKSCELNDVKRFINNKGGKLMEDFQKQFSKK